MIDGQRFVMYATGGTCFMPDFDSGNIFYAFMTKRVMSVCIVLDSLSCVQI